MYSKLTLSMTYHLLKPGGGKRVDKDPDCIQTLFVNLEQYNTYSTLLKKQEWKERIKKDSNTLSQLIIASKA